MDIGESKDGAALVLSPEGRLDSNTAKAFEEKLIGSIDGGEKAVVIDMSSLDYVSSAGLRVILMGAKRLKNAGGKFALCSLDSNVKEVFDISGFSNVLDIHGDRPSAVAAVG